MDKAQAQQLMRSMKSIIDPDIIIFAYFNDEPIGFFITVPDRMSCCACALSIGLTPEKSAHALL